MAICIADDDAGTCSPVAACDHANTDIACQARRPEPRGDLAYGRAIFCHHCKRYCHPGDRRAAESYAHDAALRPVSGDFQKCLTPDIFDVVTKVTKPLKAAFQRIVGAGEFIAIGQQPALDRVR